MRVADAVHCEETADGSSSSRSTRGRRRGRKEHLVVSLPPSSGSASSTTTTTTTNTSFEPLTPRSLLSRWLLSLQKPLSGGSGRRVVGCRVPFPRHHSKRNVSKDEEEEEEEEEEKGGVVVCPPLVDPEMVDGARERPAAPPPLVSASSESSTVEQSASSGIKPGELSLNLGLGVGLVLLLAKSATEFSKMIELQTQMAMLLKDIKEDMRRKDVPSSFTESNSQVVYSQSNYCVIENTSNSTLSQNDRASSHLVGAHGDFESDRQSRCGRAKKKPGARMNQLEVELQIELEHLQLNMQGENSYVLPRQPRIEFVAENFDPSESYDLSFVEDNEPKEEETSSHYGVPPQELERRLHELLETQQQERIVELECALECAEKMLHEKEVEICWWRDTARLVSKHKEETLFQRCARIERRTT